MKYSELPDQLKVAMRDAHPGRFMYRPASDAASMARQLYVPLLPTLPYGLLNAHRPVSPTNLTTRFYTEVSGGSGFSGLDEDVLYEKFPEQLTTETDFPVSREPNFYAVGHFHCWAADAVAYPTLLEMGALLPSHCKPAYELCSETDKQVVAHLVDFPAVNLIDYGASECDWRIYPGPPDGPQTRETFSYFPTPAPPSLKTVLLGGDFQAPIVRDRIALTIIFISRDLLKRFRDAEIVGPEYSTL